MKIQQIVGDNIRHIRQKKKLSQEALALEANMSRSYVGEVERAEKNISVDCLVKLAEALEVEPKALVLPGYYKTIKP